MKLKRASIMAAAVLALSGVTAAQANPNSVARERGGKEGQEQAEQAHVGQGSTARIIQRGDAHQAIIEQSGDGNKGRIIQIGEGRSAVLQQDGVQRSNIIQVNRGRASVDIQAGRADAGASRRGR
jgi:hypothetical protein